MDHSTPEARPQGVSVNCGHCGADLGTQYKPDDGLALFRAHRCPARFTLGTYAAYYRGDPDADLIAAVRDEVTGKLYPFGRWDSAKRAIAEMRENPDGHYYVAAVGTTDGFTPAEPGVDEGRAS